MVPRRMDEGTPQQLRPLNFGEVLDVSINVVLKNAKSLALAVAVVVIPVQLLVVLVQLAAFPDALVLDPAGADDDLTAAQLGGTLVVFVAGLVATVIATGACFKAIAEAYLGKPPEWRESIRFALGRLGSLLWLFLLYGVLASLALLLLILPGVYLWVAWGVAVPALMLEGIRGRKALGRSFRLVRGRWWAAFGILLIGFILAAVIAQIVSLVTAIPLFVAPDSVVAGAFLTLVGGVAGAIVATPIQASFVSILYFDLRVRKEGFDLSLLAEQIGASPEAAATGTPYIKSYGPPAAPPSTGSSQGAWAPPAGTPQGERAPDGGWGPPEGASAPAPDRRPPDRDG